jgi:hypothetical protein
MRVLIFPFDDGELASFGPASGGAVRTSPLAESHGPAYPNPEGLGRGQWGRTPVCSQRPAASGPGDGVVGLVLHNHPGAHPAWWICTPVSRSALVDSTTGQDSVRPSTRQTSRPFASCVSTIDPGSAAFASVRTRPPGRRRTMA